MSHTRLLAKQSDRFQTVLRAHASTAAQILQRSFGRVESAAESGAWSDYRNRLDLTERETANSVAVLNPLLADPTEATRSVPFPHLLTPHLATAAAGMI